MDTYYFIVFGVLIYIDVVYAVKLVERSEQTAIEGSSYKMKCTDLSDPGSGDTQFINPETKPIVIWSVNGKLPKGPKYKMLTDGLVIRNVSRQDASSNYTCTVLERETLTPIHSANIKLQLRQRTAKLLESVSDKRNEPSTEEKVRVWGIVSQSVKLPCRMFSRPSPTFEWMDGKSNETISNSSSLFKLMEDESSSNLTVFIHNETFFGDYICKAKNNHGESLQTFLLAEGYRPKSPFIYPTYIGKDKIVLKVEPQEIYRTDIGSQKDTLPITNYYIQYIEAESYWNAARESISKTGRFQNRNKKWTTAANLVFSDSKSPYYPGYNGETFELKNLKSNVTYLVRCAVANAAAVSDFSSAIRVTTEVVAYTPTDKDVVQDKTKLTSREEHGRASNYQPDGLKTTDDEGNQTDQVQSNETCQAPRYKKTIIRTMTTITLIEDLESEMKYGGNSSVVRRKVEEETMTDRSVLCKI